MSQPLADDSIKLMNTGATAEIGGRVEQVPVSASLEEIKRVFDRDGVVCVTHAFAPDLIETTLATFDSLMASTDMEHFIDGEAKEILGGLTKRRSEILARAPEVIAQLVAQPRMMEIIDAHLKKHCTSVLIHQVMALEIHPGEVAQPLHRDNVLWKIPGRRIPMGVAAMFPLSDFAVETGSTRVVLGSHLWPEARYFDPEEDGEKETRFGEGWEAYAHPRGLEPEMASVVEAPPGSFVLFDGATLHGGGANQTDDRVRRSLLVGYCLGWLRGETNQQLMWPPEVARDFPRELQRLIGYSVEGGILGCLQLGQDPISLLET